jgi:hypothetical protein
LILSFPNKVKIGPYYFEVDWSASDVRNPKSGQKLWGFIGYEKQQILIQDNLPRDRQLCVFFHEVLHGIDDLVHTKLTEPQITRLAPAIVAFLVENKLMADFSEGVGKDEGDVESKTQ